MRVQLHLKCVGEEEGKREGRGLFRGLTHSKRGNKENKYGVINMREIEWVGRATGVKRVEMRF